LHTALRQLIHAALRHLELEQENESLLEEFSVGWESLEAVYDISSDLRLLQDPRQLLDHITGKAVAMQEGLRAVLWLEEAGQLVPVVVKNVARPQPRPPTQGLIGKVLAERHGMLLSGPVAATAASGCDPELEQAMRLAIAPVATRQGGFGVLAVWREDDGGAFDSRTMRLVEALALQAAMVVENDRLYRASLESERLRQEVAIGSEIQQVLLLSQPPDDCPGLQIAALTLPSQRIAQRIDGDFYEFIRHRDQCLDVIVGDVMGKGIPAALLGAATKSHFLRAIGRLSSAAVGEKVPEPRQIVASMAADVAKQLIDLDSFVTVCYARFDTQRQQAEMVDCGHTRTIHYRQRTGTCQLLQGSNLPLGVIEGEQYQQLVLPFEPGDIFLFYSDGITEARAPTGVVFGEARLAAVVQAQSHLTPQALIDAIRQSVTTFSQAETFADDFTCVAVKILPVLEVVPIKRSELAITSDLGHLAQVRAFVRDLFHHPAMLRISTDRISKLELAATEAFANIVNHAYAGQADQPIRLEADVFHDRVVLRVYDWGEPFDWPVAPLPAFDGSQEGGFGIYIIAHSVDAVTYVRDRQRRNCLRLELNLRQPA
jgi:sigma-B regulation protein RsbU (phosphoserine phosphatase)